MKFDVLTEDRANGTVLTQNSTNLGTLAGHYTRQWTDETISLLGYYTRQEYHASFSAVCGRSEHGKDHVLADGSSDRRRRRRNVAAS